MKYEWIVIQTGLGIVLPVNNHYIKAFSSKLIMNDEMPFNKTASCDDALLTK